MSTGRRLAKRSIIGTKVCAPGPDGLWYSGVIQDVKTPNFVAPSGSETAVATTTTTTDQTNADCNTIIGNISADTKYIVRFDFKTQTMQAAVTPISTAAVSSPPASSSTSPTSSKSVIMEARRAVSVATASVHISPAQTLRRNAMIKEFRESDLIGPGFRSMVGVQLQPGQRVFLTYNGRETSGDVLLHDAEKDEVSVKISAIGTEEPIELKKRLEEVRLLESRRSARLADQDRDTDFARLADMGSDRRKTSHNIDVPTALTPQHNSRKRGSTYSHEDSDGLQFGNDEEMNECNAALILMKLSNSPKSPKNGEKWLGSSPGSSSASWSSGSSSPPLSDDGQITHTNSILHMDDAASARMRTTSVSTSDEGIVMDYNEDAPRKRRVSAIIYTTADPLEDRDKTQHQINISSFPEKANKPTFKCTWKGCDFIEHTAKKIERHIRNAHLGNKKARRSADYDGSLSESDHEEEFYYTEIEDDDDEGNLPSPPSQPTLSHRDMARPPHEDPEYQRQIVGNFKQGRSSQANLANGPQCSNHIGNNISLSCGNQYCNTNKISQQKSQLSNNNTNNSSHACISTSPLAHHNYTWPSAATVAVQSPSATSNAAQQHSPVSIMKHSRCSPRPSATTAPYRPYAHHQHQQQHHLHTHHQQQHQHQQHYSSSSSISSNSSCGGGSNNTSPIIHSNSSANNVLQQLSQQNVTVTAHHSNQQQQHHYHQHQQISAVSITPNYQHNNHQHQMRHIHQQQQSPTTTAIDSPANSTASASTHHNAHSPQQHHTTTHPHSNQQQHVIVQQTVAAARPTPNSPNRRTRGENKKCRKVYGMERRDQWCTQCKWKKACSRFGD